MIERQVCPFHADEDLVGQPTDDRGGYVFTCGRTSRHPGPGSHTWLYVAEPPGIDGLTGLAEDLGLDARLPAAIGHHPGRWLEYGVVEAEYAAANPDAFALLVDRYSHTAIAAKRYTSSAFLAATLGRLSRSGHVLYHPGPATGRWAYNSGISWWALPPEPDWDNRVSWAELERDMSHVPGSVE